MANIQNFFISKAPKINIPPGEYEGVLNIQHSCIVEGNGATLWSKIGAALIVSAPNVTIRNLRVERTIKTADFIAVDILSNNVILENVEIYGDIRGFENPAAYWDLPRTINFDSFAADERNEFVEKLTVGENCQVINSVYGLKVEPQILSPGENELKFTIEPMKDGMILYGNLILETSKKILRRIYLSGRAKKGAEIKRLPKVSKPFQKAHEVVKNPPSQKISPQSVKSSSSNRSVSSNKNSNIPKSTPKSENFKVIFEAKKMPVGMAIDAYAFCLNVNEKVRSDEDMIFFNNPRHESFGVYLESKNGVNGVVLDLKRVPQNIQDIAIYFAIYDEGNRSENNFSKIISPEVTIYSDGNVFYKFFPNLKQEKILKALDFYRNNDTWKTRISATGYYGDIRKICENYGVEVI